jgi:predicted nucleic acid-binding protein
MILVDTSAWVEYFRGGEPSVVEKLDGFLDRDLVAIGDLVFCEVLQGLRPGREFDEIRELLLSLPRYEMVGFPVAEQSARNYRILRTRGLTIRKTIDVIIGTFCAVNGLPLVHHDRDFDLMAPHIGLKVL